MSRYRVSHLPSARLRQGMLRFHSNSRRNEALFLSFLAEFDAQRLYLPEAFPSMHQFCTRVLNLAGDAAEKRIRVARVARMYPQMFPMLADGRLNLTVVGLLAPILTHANVNEVLAEAAFASCAEVREIVARRAPRPDLAPRLTPVPPPMPVVNSCEVGLISQHVTGVEPALERVEELLSAKLPVMEMAQVPVPEHVVRHMRPLAPERYALQVTLPREIRDKIEYAKSLMSHVDPSGDLANVIARAIDELITVLEREKFAATGSPRASNGTSSNRRVSAEVKRAVWKRDGGRCTFTSSDGRRCDSRHRLEFDHATAAALGGEASVENLRLRCRAHNQYTAAQELGAEVMHAKREAARARRAFEHEQRTVAAVEMLDAPKSDSLRAP